MGVQRSGKRFYTPRDASKILGFAERILANPNVKRRECKYCRKGWKILYEEDEFEGWVKSNFIQTRLRMAE